MIRIIHRHVFMYMHASKAKAGGGDILTQAAAPVPPIPRRACPRCLDRKIPRQSGESTYKVKEGINIYTLPVCASIGYFHNRTNIVAEGRGR